MKTALHTLLTAAVLAAVACSEPSERLPLPIETVDVVLMESQPVQVSVRVRGYLPDSCYVFAGVAQSRNGNTFVIELDMTRTADDDAVCLQRIEIVEHTVALGSLPPGDYRVTVNGIERSFRVD